MAARDIAVSMRVAGERPAAECMLAATELGKQLLIWTAVEHMSVEAAVQTPASNLALEQLWSNLDCGAGAEMWLRTELGQRIVELAVRIHSKMAALGASVAFGMLVGKSVVAAA